MAEIRSYQPAVYHTKDRKCVAPNSTVRWVTEVTAQVSGKDKKFFFPPTLGYWGVYSHEGYRKQREPDHLQPRLRMKIDTVQIGTNLPTLTSISAHSTMTMEATGSSEMMVQFYQAARRHIPLSL